MTTVNCFANYGLSGHEKEIMFSEQSSEICDKSEVYIPDEWEVYQNIYGGTCLKNEKISKFPYNFEEVVVSINDTPYLKLVTDVNSERYYSKKLDFKIFK